MLLSTVETNETSNENCWIHDSDNCFHIGEGTGERTDGYNVSVACGGECGEAEVDEVGLLIGFGQRSKSRGIEAIYHVI